MDRNEYTIQPQTDGLYSVLCNGRAILAGLTKGHALNAAAQMEAAQVADMEESE